MSSDAYFYTVGGGYKDQKGLGITNIDKYLRLFGFGTAIPDSFFSGGAGTIPTPEWKMKTFNENWYLGDTYHTAIGQYGFQVTPMQIVRGIASVANGGNLLIPTVLKGDMPQIESTITSIPQSDFDVVKQGMRLGAQIGTSVALNVPYVNIAGKSGTAELGTSKEKVNSWITGFWPYENPKYAFAVTLENGSVHNLIGAAAAMRQQLDWMNANTPEYFK
jgi:penicillin-binding protein 2